MPLVISLAAVFLLVIIFVTYLAQHYQWPAKPYTANQSTNQELDFPDFNTSDLSPLRFRILTILKQEHDQPGAGTKYSEGVRELWCADFVSWVMREANVPLSNPNSGSWRIPGVATLQEYFESQGQFGSLASDYQPKPGDVVIYGAEGVHGQHTNFVVAVSGNEITTVGGNEGNQIRIQRFDSHDQKHAVIGFGVVEP